MPTRHSAVRSHPLPSRATRQQEQEQHPPGLPLVASINLSIFLLLLHAYAKTLARLSYSS